ncbi:unnamed protein product [Saccharomyces cerevisiae]|nr:unnamed protein product [Saccharomyces cerevisiae]
MPPPTAQFMGPTQAGQNESQNQSSGEAGEQNQEHGQGPTPILNQSQSASSQPQHQQQRNESISYYTNFNQPRYSTDASINSFLNISDNVPVTSTGGPSSGGAYSNLPRLSTSTTSKSASATAAVASAASLQDPFIFDGINGKFFSISIFTKK